jgi:putative flippase GtrA
MAAEIQELTTIPDGMFQDVGEIEAFGDTPVSLTPAARARALFQERRHHVALVARYSTTSVVAFGVSEIALLLLYGKGVAGATVCTLIANIAGTIPSYLMSRYWIWKDSDRRRVGRQVFLYWTTSAVFIALTSLATGGIAKLAPAGHTAHLEFVAVAFPVVTVLFWVAKLFVYQKLIFTSAQPAKTL